MKSSFFKKIGLAFLILFGAMCFTAHAQINSEHFIYIQAKNKQPFYAILNNKLYSSSNIGYLIIPKLQSGTYDLKIGFPKQIETERDYMCVINDEDLGYSLQKKDNGDWGLLDLQSQTFLTAATSAATNTATQNQLPSEAPAATTTAQNNNQTADNTSATQSSSFGNMLSDVANDSTLKVQPVIQKKQPAPAVAISTDNSDNSATTVAPQPTNNYVTDNIQNTNSPVDETYGIIKTNETRIDDGQQMTFVLFNSHTTDTVQILIPMKALVQPTTLPSDTNAVQNKNYQTKNTLPLFDNDGDIPNNNVSSSNAASIASANTGTQSASALCENPLTDKEMIKLQKKIISKTTDDEMLSVVDKAIKGKCIATEQVRLLGTSFLSDAGRFALYQDVYGNVSDKENYASLQNQLLDSYFKKRFTDMLNQ